MVSLIIHEIIGHHLQAGMVPKIENEAFKFSENVIH